tara:strand:+ start:835 stop:1608 length:774 start_codon:yes stop_codon:yes gene_type:complete
MSGLMEGKVGIVTGAGAGIGRASARAFAEEGAKVVVSDLDPVEGEETVRLIKEAGGQALFFKCDVTDEEQVKALVDFCVSQYGRLDWAHNNAGITGEHSALADMTTENWDRVIKTNLYGCYFSMKHEIPAMLKSGGGAIVNTGSNVGVVSARNAAAYGTSKFAVRGLTQVAALDYAKIGIRINSISPGMTDTPNISSQKKDRPESVKAYIDNIPMGCEARPEDQANAAVFLCSDKASHITATDLLVDGGQFAEMVPL